MEKRMKSRMVLLGSLLVIGLILAGIGSVLGAGAVVQEKMPMRLEAISEGNITKIAAFRDGTEVGTYYINMSEKQAISVTSIPSGEIRIEKVTCEGKDLTEEVKERAKKIALSDSMVQKRLEGEEYEIRTVTSQVIVTMNPKECKVLDTATVFINLLGIEEWFDVWVDLKEGNVTHIGPLLPIPKPPEKHKTELNKLLEIAKKDSRVQEIIAGKNYQPIGMGQAGTSEKTIAVLGLEVEGKYYKVAVDLKSEAVTSVEEQNSSKIEIIERG